MDQIRIGRFIAETRKTKGLTQRQLAEALSISDKTVSKWECGKGLPEVSLMMPLCGVLDITVNDLLSGERVSPDRYQQKAEGHLMDLMKENEENRRRLWCSMACGAVTVVAVCGLVALASLVPMAAAVRLGLIAAAVVTAVIGIGAAAELDRKAGQFECPYCKALFVPDMGAYVKGDHTLTRRRLTCPVCGRRGMCRHRVVR